MRNLLVVLALTLGLSAFSQAVELQYDFENLGGLNPWYNDDCGLELGFANPFPEGINTSASVMRYADNGGLYANVGLDVGKSLNLNTNSVFTMKIYVPSNSLVGTQNHQVSLKLQNGLLDQPWTTQSEIIKPIVLDQWQELTFDFSSDPFFNFSAGSGHPMNRWDFSRILIQVNGENNSSQVTAYIDDFNYVGSITEFDLMVWNDEFNVNGVVNSLNWHHQTQLPNGVSWYNDELQHYTANNTNSVCANGRLYITAKKEVYTSQGQTKQYTSARLNSKFAFKYGRVEARAKLPTGAGTWPAIWMLGKNINENGGYWDAQFGTANWPACGEIDIMEHWGSNQNTISSAVHHPVNGDLTTGTYSFNEQVDEDVSTEYHVYAVEWTEESITFSVDGYNHMSYRPSVQNQYTWPFDAPQYILMNIAIEPSVAVSFLQSAMEVDYVRVYQTAEIAVAEETPSTGLNVYPNPASNQCTIAASASTNGVYEVYSCLGQMVSAGSILGTTTIDMSDFDRGLYFVVIRSASGTQTTKLIKQ
jgi:beta-glucanase (GH16 family)